MPNPFEDFERLNEKLGRILKILENELTEKEIEESNRISDRVRRGEKIPLNHFQC